MQIASACLLVQAALAVLQPEGAPSATENDEGSASAKQQEALAACSAAQLTQRLASKLQVLRAALLGA